LDRTPGAGSSETNEAVRARKRFAREARSTAARGKKRSRRRRRNIDRRRRRRRRRHRYQFRYREKNTFASRACIEMFFFTTRNDYCLASVDVCTECTRDDGGRDNRASLCTTCSR